MLKTAATAIGVAFMIIAGFAGLAVIYTLPVKWLINYLFTPAFLLFVFGVVKFTFWRAYALAFLCSFLIKSTVSSK